MAPPRKVPPGGVTRSVLLRADQVAALDAAAGLLGADLSDVVRGAVDLLFPADPADVWARTRAALELRRREFADDPGRRGAAEDDPGWPGRPRRPLRDRAELVRAVLDGWRGAEPRLPLGAAGLDAARLVGEAVGMLRALFPGGERLTKAGAAERWAALPGDWAGTAPSTLLTVLACPAARCWAEGKREDRRPDGILLARAVAAPAPETPRERQYAPVVAAVDGLVDGQVLVKIGPEEDGWPGWPHPVVAYEVVWKRVESSRGK